MDSININNLIQKIRLLIKKEKKSKDEERIIVDYKDEFKKVFTDRINKAGKLSNAENILNAFD
jgi:hypothetical protein